MRHRSCDLGESPMLCRTRALQNVEPAANLSQNAILAKPRKVLARDPVFIEVASPKDSPTPGQLGDPPLGLWKRCCLL